MAEKKSLMNAPRYVQVLFDLIQRWENTPYGTILYLKEPYVPHVLVKYKRLPLTMDVKTQLSYETTFPLRGKLNEREEEACRLLYGMSCKLSWVRRGIITMEPKFVSSSFLEQIKKSIPDLKIGDGLSNLLDNDAKIKRLIKSIRPEDLDIIIAPGMLTSKKIEWIKGDIPEGEQDMRSVLLNLFVTSYNKPTDIIWIFSISKLIYLTRQRKDLMGMLEILSYLSSITNDFTKKIIEEKI
jgi:hypothetical protein